MRLRHIVAAIAIFSTASFEAATAKSFGQCVYEGGRHSPKAVAIACVAGHDYTFGRYKRHVNHKKGNDIDGHEFHSKPIYITRTGGQTIVTGSLSHMLRNRPDDVLDYRITKSGDTIIGIEENLNRGGFSKFGGPLASAIAAYVGVPLDPKTSTELLDIVGDSVHSTDWRTAARAIIVEVAVLVDPVKPALVTPAAPIHGDQLLPNQGLLANQSIQSGNGAYKLTFQGDGNLVLYSGGKAKWASNTNGESPQCAIMQSDGNFVVYNSSMQAKWTSNTRADANLGSRLIIQNDGNLVIYNTSDQPIWASNTVGP